MSTLAAYEYDAKRYCPVCSKVHWGYSTSDGSQSNAVAGAEAKVRACKEQHLAKGETFASFRFARPNQ